MLKKTIPLRIRINQDLYKLLNEMAVEYKCSVSELIRLAIKFLFEHTDTSGMQNELRLILIKDKKREINSKLYLVKNMYKRILDIAMSNYFMTGGINMKAINLSLDIYVKEFECYEDKIKDAIGTDFKMTVKRLRDQNFLLEQSQTIKKLKMIEGR